ncbi:PD-(D/E)XK nuclease-like domain-containing protein [Leifsonia poae]|uniref:PD-(D/E)XK nuclease-like domain-containing protein n=1 Tax=Leifsonia poae TaxID=110933 RepID=UPI001CBA8CC0|nr:PD-(D/E)XK nuclease-like domain-containing protein [Leifsonia poae]
MTATLAGIIPDLPDDEYHRRPELSSTGVRKILEAPAIYRHYMDTTQPGKRAFDVGHVAHAKVLGVGTGVIEYPPEHLTPSGNVSTKKATEEWAAAQRALGFAPVSPDDVGKVDAMAEAVLAHPDARSVLETVAGREVSLFATIDGVPMRARFDIYDGINGGDLKTARDASPRGFNAAVGRLGYHIQDRWYAEAHTAITGTELESFKFIVVETAAPHLVGVYDLDFMWEDLAKERTKRARELYARCTETNTWPGYQSATLTPPTWALYENEEEEIQV